MSSPAKGQHHRLVLYSYILNRMWGQVFNIGIVLLLLVAVITWLPGFLPDYKLPHVAAWILKLTAGVGLFAVFLALFLFAIRKSAYVQPYDTHLRLVTPFLRMNISYRRFRQASSAEMGSLFPPEKFKGQKRDFLRPLSHLTAIVLELDNWPMPRWFLNLFLSPYFFPDKTPRIALLVQDWIHFSTELESFRGTWLAFRRTPESTPQSNLLESFSDNR